MSHGQGGSAPSINESKSFHLIDRMEARSLSARNMGHGRPQISQPQSQIQQNPYNKDESYTTAPGYDRRPSDLFLHFLGYDSRIEREEESSVGSNARREMIIKATTNIYDTSHISWPDNVLAKLVLANEIMSISSCPCLFGGLKHVALKSGSLLASLARNWGFSPSTIALGSAYFQRLVAVQKEGLIGQWVQVSSDFKSYRSIAKENKECSISNDRLKDKDKAVRTSSYARFL
jgi:hypothetical protein